jgi:hypothetical protein
MQYTPLIQGTGIKSIKIGIRKQGWIRKCLKLIQRLEEMYEGPD